MLFVRLTLNIDLSTKTNFIGVCIQHFLTLDGYYDV